MTARTSSDLRGYEQHLERLNKALSDIDEGMGVYDEVTPTLEVVIEAARAYRDLLVARRTDPPAQEE